MSTQTTNVQPAALRVFWWVRNRWLEILLVGSLVALSGQLLPDARRMWREWPWAGYQTPGRALIELGSNATAEVEYYVYLPPEYSRGQEWPLLLYLHGAGERGDHELHKVLRTGPAAGIAKGRSLPMIVVTPQCHREADWNAGELLALLDKLEIKFAVDKDRVYVAGFSRGGYGTWKLIAAAPERFAAAIPVAGGGNPELATQLVELPIWAFHGRRDNSVPVERSKEMIEAIKAVGGKAKLTIYPDAGHGIDHITFGRNDVYQWLLKQRRNDGKISAAVN